MATAGFIWVIRTGATTATSALAAGLAAWRVKGDWCCPFRQLVMMFVDTCVAWLARSGADHRLMPDEAASASAACWRRSPADQHAARAANPALEFIWRIGEGGFDEIAWAARSPSMRTRGRGGQRSTTTIPAGSSSPPAPPGRSKAAVLTHGQMGFVVTNHLGRSHARRRPRADASLVVAPLSHGAGVHQLVQTARGVPTDPAADREVRHRRGLPPDRDAPGQQHLHRADHPEDDGRASRRRQVRSLLAALRHLCRRADVPRGPEGGAEASSARCWCSISGSAKSPATSR